MVRLLHDGVCWLLSGVLLLTNGWPVAVQHAHDVGDNPYHHSHHSEGASPPRSPLLMIDADDAVAGVTEHVHMLWLGWELTILPPKGSRPNPCPSASAAGMLASADKPSDDADPSAAEELQASAALTLRPDLRTNVAVEPGDSVVHIAALPLCDTARHLRSGVQLA